MRVLVVEDDVTIAGNLVDYLRGRGHAVDWAASGGQVLARLDAGSYDVMVLDIGLPGMDGLRLLRLLRTEWRYEFPILMLTALDRKEDKLAGFQGGADDYVVKPFSLAEVEVRLLALVRRRGVVAEPHVLLALGQAVMFDPARFKRKKPHKPTRSTTSLLRNNNICLLNRICSPQQRWLKCDSLNSTAQLLRPFRAMDL